MKHTYEVLPIVHVEITLGLRNSVGHNATTVAVTRYLQELNKQRIADGMRQMTFKVFSGYAPHVQLTETTQTEVTENVALLHLDYNPAVNGEERWDTCEWYVNRLMDHFQQSVAYAHVSSSNGHYMVMFQEHVGAHEEDTKKEPAN